MSAVAGTDCPDCGCCTRALCELGAAAVGGCAGQALPESVELVRGCPCSSSQAPGTAAALMVRWGREMELLAPAQRERCEALLKERVLDAPGPDVEALRGLIAELWPAAA